MNLSRKKITLTILLAALIYALMGSYLLRLAEKDYLEKLLSQQAEINFDILTALSSDAIIMEDREKLQDVINMGRKHELSVNSIRFENETGRLLAYWGPSLDNTKKNSHSEEENDDDEHGTKDKDSFGDMTLTKDVNINGEVFGKITVSFKILKVLEMEKIHLGLLQTFIILFSLGLSLLTLAVLELLGHNALKTLSSQPDNFTDIRQEAIEKESTPQGEVEKANEPPKDPELSIPADAPQVLVVDDEEVARNTAKKILNQKQLRVYFAEEADSGLDKLKDKIDQTALIILPLVVLEMLADTERIFKAYRESKPDCKILFSVASLDKFQIPKSLEGQTNIDFVEKPFKDDTLSEKAVKFIPSLVPEAPPLAPPEAPAETTEIKPEAKDIPKAEDNKPEEPATEEAKPELPPEPPTEKTT